MGVSPSHGEPNFATILRGVIGVARGDGEAIRCFGHTERSFLVSLAPIGLFVLLGNQGVLFGGDLGRALVGLLASACALLVPPVVSHWLAHRWQRDEAWARFATAFNWCQFALMICVLVAISVAGMLGGQRAVLVMAFLFGLYALWLHWFLARRGLFLSVGRAVILVISVHIATTLAILMPRMIAAALRA